MIEGFLKELLSEAALLGLSWWERIGAIFALALFIVLAKGAAGALGKVRLPAPPPEWDPEKRTGLVSPPVDMPPGGTPVPGPGGRWDRNEP